MLIGTQTAYHYRTHKNDESAIRLLAEVGFDCVDISLFEHHKDEDIWQLPDDEFDCYFRHLAEVAKECGVKIDQTHAPFPTWDFKDPEEDARRMEALKLSIRASSILGARYTVIHPGPTYLNKYGANAALVREINMEHYNKLRPFLEEYGIMCAIENMFSRDRTAGRICPTVCSRAEELASYIDELGSDCFCACLDIGHANLIHCDGYETVNHADMIRILGKRLKALHVQDNDCVDDNHLAPYSGNFDWESVCDALREVKYDGVFTLEADNFYNRYPIELEKDCARFMCSIARHLANKIG